ncbi:CMP-N-acetylneuraminate-beta-galactosamide-alpha-2,3-sialyltransferase 1-like [Corticium candelabrum]|uniref:CMP-N-acetylneuraminate-beta-galactosamide- alpha-2,3-sialyltransferase 1-like n=1 Tax=Corticium candelabrum TaxID=121492 RepID=UPI002E256AF3|nr:CMP-N-acetylneuraminate-beta-galactosamide-alpha-2,3-sialyltransferase 1-like [Corticium candelabrum]
MKTRIVIAILASCLILAWVTAYRTRQNTPELNRMESRPRPKLIIKWKPRNKATAVPVSTRNQLPTAARPAANQLNSKTNNNSMVESPYNEKPAPPRVPAVVGQHRATPAKNKYRATPAKNKYRATPAKNKYRATPTRVPVICRSNEQAKIKSTWFASRINRNVPVFLNKVNSSLAGSARRWWLSNMHRKDISLDAAIRNLIEVVPGLASIRENRASCITCAIIGNAGNLQGSGYGNLIDSKDFIIRANKSPTKGFERDVGALTTHQIVYPESADGYHPGATMLVLPFKEADIRWLASIFTTKNVTRGFWRHVPASVSGASPEKTFTIHPAFLHYVHTVWLSNPPGKWPSAGDVSIVLGLHICDELHVMGFGASKYNRWDHYYTARNANAGLPIARIHHPAVKEASLRNKLQQDGIINLYPGKA